MKLNYEGTDLVKLFLWLYETDVVWNNSNVFQLGNQCNTHPSYSAINFKGETEKAFLQPEKLENHYDKPWTPPS